MLKHYINQIKKPFIWAVRFRKRRGYGVHSPFAFNFITTVLYQRGQFYNYKLINELPRSRDESKRILKLIFRLVNFIQPKTIVYRSTNSFVPKVMRWSRSDVQISTSFSDFARVDLAYLSYQTPMEDLVNEIGTLWPSLHENSMLIIYGIGYSKEMKTLWSELIKDEKSGISFDLYDLGILFFNNSMNKQDYIVNF
jgi:hypothetical protein